MIWKKLLCVTAAAVLFVSLASCSGTTAVVTTVSAIPPAPATSDTAILAHEIQPSPQNTPSVSTPAPQSTPSPDTSAPADPDSVAAAYLDYLSTLSVHDVGSIQKALEKYKETKSDTSGKELNDKLFRYFMSFFALAQNSLQDTLLPAKGVDVIFKAAKDGKYWPVNADADIKDTGMKEKAAQLRQNGFAAFKSEAGVWLIEDPSFVLDYFKGSVSDGVGAYLSLRSGDLKVGSMIDDMALLVSWDELSDRVIRWENYAKKYPESPEAAEASKTVKDDLNIYLSCDILDNTPMFKKKLLTDELKASYKRFVKTYSDSAYIKLISGYLDILKNNGYKQTDKVKYYMIHSGYEFWSSKGSAPNDNTVLSSSYLSIKPVAAQFVSIVMTAGSSHRNAGDFEYSYQGKFNLVTEDSSGKTISKLDLNKIFGVESLVFMRYQKLALEDYNDDGYMDFTVGQKQSDGSFAFYIFSVTADGKLVNLPEKLGKPIRTSQDDLSALFKKTGKETFSVDFTDKTTGKTTVTQYQWQSGSFAAASD